MKYYAADKLHIEVPHTGHPFGCFPDDCKGFRQNIIQGFSLLQAQLKFPCLGLEVGRTHLLHLRLQGIDFIHNGLDVF